MKLSDPSSGIVLMYNRIYKVYRFLNFLLTLGLDEYWRKKTIYLSKMFIENPSKILDCACGCGDLTVHLEREFRDAKIYAVDGNSNMLLIANKRTKRAILVNSMCDKLPFEDEFFDAVFVSFALRNLYYSANRQKIFNEIARVIRKGGFLISVETSYPENKVFAFFIRVYLNLIFFVLIFFLNREEKKAYLFLKNSIIKFKVDDFLKERKEFNFFKKTLFPFIIKVIFGVKN